MVKPLNKQIIIRTVIVFLVSYLISLFLWIQVKDYYGYAVTFTASKLVGGLKDVKLDKIVQERDIIRVIFNPSRYKMGIIVKTSPYLFNAPLTFGIMAALYIFISRKRRAYAEAILMLLCVHLLYVMSYEAKLLTEFSMSKGIEAVSYPRLFVYQFLWVFTENMVIRFEPFLIGVYVFIKFRK